MPPMYESTWVERLHRRSLSKVVMIHSVPGHVGSSRSLAIFRTPKLVKVALVYAIKISAVEKNEHALER
jgi:hypothetical protein